MARKERRPVSAADKELLVRLQAALPSLRQSVVLSEAIANCSAQRRSRHPVLNFAFARAPAAVWENTLLRVAEALVLIDSALVPSGRRSLFSGKGRDRMPVDRDFADCIRLRHEVVAHRARRLGDGKTVVQQVVSRHSSVFRYQLALLDKIAEQVGLLSDLGVIPHFCSTPASLDATGFSTDDVTRLVDAANLLVG